MTDEEVNNVLKGPQWKGDGAPPENVVVMGGETILNVPIERVLNGAWENQLEEVLLIGWKEGELYTAASYNDAGKMMLRMEQAKQRILKVVE